MCRTITCPFATDEAAAAAADADDDRVVSGEEAESTASSHFAQTHAAVADDGEAAREPWRLEQINSPLVLMKSRCGDPGAAGPPRRPAGGGGVSELTQMR